MTDVHGNYPLQLARRLVVRVGRVVAPAVVHRETGLPRPPGRLGRDELLRRVEVAESRESVVDQDVRLQRADEVMQPPGAPFRARSLPAAVEPEQVDGAILGEQLAHLGEQERHEALPLLRRRPRHLPHPIGPIGVGERRIVGVMPVGEREVEADAQARRPGRVDELAHQVAAIGRRGDREVAGAGREEREAVVMLGGEHRVAHAGASRARQPVAGALRPRAERRRALVVRGRGNVLTGGKHRQPADQRPR